MTIRSVHGFTFHDHAAADMEESAAAANLRTKPSTGMLIARKLHGGGATPMKSQARALLIKHYRDRAWPRPLQILTLPGLKWSFERALVGAREAGRRGTTVQSGRYLQPIPSATTEIWATESDPAIFKASLHWMPGRPITVCSAWCVETPFVRQYRFGDIEDVLEHSPVVFDAAWLDFSGALTERRLRALKTFWCSSLRHSMTVTFLAARTMSREQAVHELAACLPGHTEIEHLRYEAMEHLMFGK